MIQLYTGTPGSGKSLHVAHEIRDFLRIGKYVISSCDIDTDLCFLGPFKKFYVNFLGKKPKHIKHDKRADLFTFKDIHDITPEYLTKWAAVHHVYGKEHQTIVILDECVAIFSPTVISNDNKRWNEWDNFFRLHRHYGFDLILIPQSKRLMLRKVIEYCEYEVKHYNRKNQGMLGWIFSLFLGSLFSYSTCWRGTHDKPLEQGFFTYKPIFGLMYNSYSMFNDLIPIREKERNRLMLSLADILKERAVQLNGLNQTVDN